MPTLRNVPRDLIGFVIEFFIVVDQSACFAIVAFMPHKHRDEFFDVNLPRTRAGVSCCANNLNAFNLGASAYLDCAQSKNSLSVIPAIFLAVRFPFVGGGVDSD